ncbi:MAG: extracellular solute-binding protein, partial [Clostridiales bacterium]|nr:extracellular solute-binding protein [Clostridiales bacterium]
MKKALSLILVILLLGAASAASADTLEVWVWNNDGAYAAVYETAVELFHEEYPDVEVVFNTIAYADYNTALKAAIFGGEAPDVMQVPSTMITSLCESGALMPLTDALASGQFPEFYGSTVEKLKYDGDDYMVPFNVISYQVAYNKAIFRELNLDVPSTIEELLAVNRVLTDNGHYGISVGTNDKWVGAYLIYNLNIYRDPSHALINRAERGEIPWAETMLGEAADTLGTYLAAGLFAPGANSMDAFVGAQQLFVQGDAAMFYPFGSFDSASIL